MSQSAGVITTLETALSAIRLELRPGEWVLWDTRPHRFETLLGDRARLRDPTAAELRDVPVSEIRGLPTLPLTEIDARMETARTIDPSVWSMAQSREAAVRAFLDGDGPVGNRLSTAANLLGVTPRTVRRLAARYRVSAQTTSLVPRLPGPNKVRRRLGAIREKLITEAIETRYLVKPRTPIGGSLPVGRAPMPRSVDTRTSARQCPKPDPSARCASRGATAIRFQGSPGHHTIDAGRAGGVRCTRADSDGLHAGGRNHRRLPAPAAHRSPLAFARHRRGYQIRVGWPCRPGTAVRSRCGTLPRTCVSAQESTGPHHDF